MGKFLKLVAVGMLASSPCLMASDFVMTCEVNKMPVDGPLISFRLAGNSSSNYTLTRATQSAGMDGRVRRSRAIMAKGMTCLEPVKGFSDGSVQAVFCQLDQRPVDGGVTMVSLVRNTLGRYTIQIEEGSNGSVLNPEPSSSSRVLGEDFPCEIVIN